MKVAIRGSIIVIAIASIFYSLLIAYSGLNQFQYVLRDFNILFLPIILGLHVLALILRGVRQRLFLDTLGIKLSLKENIRINFAGMLLIFTPFATGEVVRTYFLKEKYRQSYVKTIPAIFMERYHDFVALTSILALMSVFQDLFAARILVGIVSIILVFSFILLKNKTIYKKIIPLISKIKKLRPAMGNIDEIYDSLTKLASGRITFFGWIITFISYIIDAASAYFVFKAFGISFSYVLSTLLVYTSTLFGAVSLLPGGLGVTEGSLVGLLSLNGLDFVRASAIVLLIRITSIWFSQVLGFAYFKLMRFDKL